MTSSASEAILVSHPACFSVQDSLSWLDFASEMTRVSSRTTHVAPASAAVSMSRRKSAFAVSQALTSLSAPSYFSKIFPSCALRLFSLCSRSSDTRSTAAVRRLTLACKSVTTVSCAPFFTTHASLAASHFVICAEAVSRAVSDSARVLLSVEPQSATDSKRLAIRVALAPLSIMTDALASTHSLICAFSVVVASTSAAAVTSIFFSAAAVSASKSSMMVLNAPPWDNKNSRFCSSSLTCPPKLSLVVRNKSAVVFNVFSHRPTLVCKSSTMVMCAPFVTRHCSFASVISLIRFSLATLVAFNATLVSTRLLSQRKTLDFKSPITVLCAPLSETHVFT